MNIRTLKIFAKASLTTLVSLGVVQFSANAADPIEMLDVTAAVGLDNDFFYSDTGHSLGVIWFDFNNDGYPDILATNGYDDGSGMSLRPHLYFNDRRGGFRDADALLPDLPNYDYAGAIAADYDRDGDTDLYLYTAHDEWHTGSAAGNPYDGPPNLLLKNNFVENGNKIQENMFTDVAAEAGVDLCTPGFEAQVQAAQSVVKYGCRQTRSATFLDYDLDGWVDLYIAQMVINRVGDDDPLGQTANTDGLFKNMGDGTFQRQANGLVAEQVTNRATLALRSSHLNDDRYPDVYIGNTGAGGPTLEENLQDGILLNNTEGQLVQAHDYIGNDTPAVMGITFADINDDGKFDIYISDVPSHPSNDLDPNRVGNTLYVSHDTGFTQNVSHLYGVDFYLTWGVSFDDLNLDGKMDLFAGAGRPSNPNGPQTGGDSAIFTNLGPTTTTSQPVATTNARGTALADYDKDGDRDLLVVNQNGHLQLFRNLTADTLDNNALIIDFEPTRSNLDAYGLKAELTTESGKKLVRQIQGGSSLHSLDETRMFFGLGDETAAELKLYWPHLDTPVQTITNISGTHLVVQEP